MSVTFLTIFGAKKEAKMLLKGAPKLRNYDTCFLHAPKSKNASFWDPQTLKFMLLA